MSEAKPVDLKNLLENVNKLRAESPELANKMMDEFIKEADHRREMDRLALQAQIRAVLLGQISALLVGLTAIISGALIAAQGSQWAGGFIGGGGVIGLVSAFLGRRKT